MVNYSKVWLSILCWALCLPAVLAPKSFLGLEFIGLIFFLFYIALAFLKLRRQSLIFVVILLMLGSLLIGNLPSWKQLLNSSDFILVFACLVPTLALMRATAMTMPSVQKTQKKLAALEPENSALGIQLTSHLIGGVINIGTFSLISVAIPKDANMERRRIAAVSSMRGMNSAILWSPFFISFAVASVYLPKGFATGSILLGFLNAMIFFIITQAFYSPRFGIIAVKDSIRPLKPIISRLFIIGLCIMLTSYFTGLSALRTVCAVMPLMCLIQIFRRIENYKIIWTNFKNLQKYSGDEIVIISISMLIATQVSQSEYLISIMSSFFGSKPLMYPVLVSMPVIVWLSAVIGVHPVVSSAPLLAYFAPSLTVYDAIFVAQAHMIGWASGTMVSFASLSTILVSEQFKLRNVMISFGENFPIAGSLAIGGGLTLCILHATFKNFP